MDVINVMFVGHFSSIGAVGNASASAAGDLVQKQIIKDSIKTLGRNNFFYISLEPQSCWPRGSFLVPSVCTERGFFPAYINLPLVKNLIFSFWVFLIFLKKKPKLVMQYNSYLLENFTLVCMRLLFGIKIVSIVQDVRSGDQFTVFARIHDFLANKLIRVFDMVLPVSEKLANYLCLKKNRYHVFQGGLTELTMQAVEVDSYERDIAVFAGALEPHNGADKLLSAWVSEDMPVELHIFGKGSLSNYILNFVDNKRVFFHGFKDADEVYEWQKIAKYNICLRYSSGLDEEFFFPSKFFGVACCPGLLVLNAFKGAPDFLLSSPGLLSADLGNLKKILSTTDQEIHRCAKARRQYLSSNCSWEGVLRDVYSKQGVRI